MCRLYEASSASMRIRPGETSLIERNQVSSSTDPSSSASWMNDWKSSSARFVRVFHSSRFTFLPGRFAVVHPDQTLWPRTSYNDPHRAHIPALEQDLAGFLVGEDLSLHPLQGVVDGLRVTA